MITEVYIDGYRSLSKLTIPIRPGLNIFVGPNGGGKTNILSLFELISRLTERPVDEAVSSHGGVGRVFRRLSDESYSDRLECKIRGRLIGRDNNKIFHTWYTWHFIIAASPDYDEISYIKQKLYLDAQSLEQDENRSDLIISMSSEGDRDSITVERCIISRLQSIFRSMFFIQEPGYIPLAKAKQLIGFVSRSIDPRREAIFGSVLTRSQIFRRIASDIAGGEIFNITPDVCKQPENSARPPIIEKNGGGLASTLHRVFQSEKIGPRRSSKYSSLLSNSPGLNRNLPSVSRRVKSYVRLINDSVIDIDTRKNAFDNTISVVLTIEDQNSHTAFPLLYCSDGMVKWIALITKLLVSPSGFSIEEPENFLHPNIQKEFLRIVRNETDSLNKSKFTLMTTHSESLLNEAKPDEVILVWMQNGSTVAKRITRSEDILEEINRTGFGLGYYYTVGALSDA